MLQVRKLPLWLRYVIAFTVAAALFAAVVVYVDNHQQEAEGLPASPNPVQAAQEQSEDLILVKQQQAPHVAKATTAPRRAASTAVTAFMSDQVAHGFIVGPLDGKTACTADGGSAHRWVFRCKVTAGQGADKLSYPFDAVVQPAAAKVTYCQVVTSPDPGVASPPVSPLCR